MIPLNSTQEKFLRDNGFEESPSKPGLWVRPKGEKIKEYIDLRDMPRTYSVVVAEDKFIDGPKNLLRSLLAMKNGEQQSLF